MEGPARSRTVVALAVCVCAALVGAAAPAHADPALCKKMVVKQLLKYTKTHLKRHERCLNKENVGDVPGPCPDAEANAKIAITNSKVKAKIAAKCALTDLVTLGYRSDCVYGPATTGIQAQCAALPVTTPGEFAECLKCWKGAAMVEFAALLYASHAIEVCGGSLDASSPVCSDLGCTAPLPEQRDLGDNSENDCQRGIGRAGINYIVKRAKILEKCLLNGGTQASCLADPLVQLDLADAAARKDTTIRNKCGGNRVPSATSNFCCRCGPMGGTCTTVPLTREDCLADPSCQVQEGKTCNTGTGKCDPTPKEITWWEFCPQSASCPGTALASIDDLVTCVDTSTDRLVDETVCLQFPGVYACP